MDDVKLALPKFLQLLTENNVPVRTAMLVAGKIYKDYNTPAQLRELDDLKLIRAEVNEKNVRQLILAALRKVGYASSRASRLKRKNGPEDQLTNPGPSDIHPPATQETSPAKRRRKGQDVNSFIPEPRDKGTEYHSLSFTETLDEQILRMKSVVINRAPVMMAWAFIVAERLGFKPEEALSIAAVYTEMNAISKGVSLGIYEQGKEKLDTEKHDSQPFVDVMGRRPLFRTQVDQWRAMANNTPVSPSQAYSYITRSFRRSTSHVMGSLTMLADSFPTEELNNKAWGLYAQFRPHAEGWGRRAEMKCSTILDLRKAQETLPVQQAIDNPQGSEGEQKNEDNKHASS